MSDRMFASEGDPVDVGRQELSARLDRWDDDRAGRGAGPHGTGPAERDQAVGGVARRLQGRLERHLWLLDRLRSDQLRPEPAEVPDLLESSRRMRRDTESLLLLCGQDPGARPDGPRRLSDVLGEAAAAAAEPRRVEVRHAPAASLSAAASVEFLHVLAELVDHVTTVHPGARLEVAGRVEPRGGITVEVSVDGPARHDPDGLGGRRAALAATLLAQRSRTGIELRHPPDGVPSNGSGLVAGVHCPAVAVTVEEFVPVGEPFRSAPTPNGNGHRNGNGNGHRNGHRNGNGRPLSASVLDDVSAPVYAPSASSQIDELFGPLLDLPLEPIDDRFATPIFEAIASAWFREDAAAATGERAGNGRGGGAEPMDWESPSDREWRAAAARAARPDPTPATASGLPRRRPGDQLVPPLATDRAPEVGSTERVPDRVRERLATYQRGLAQGRHRAPGAEDPEAGPRS